MNQDSVKDDLKQIGELGKKIASDLFAEAKVKAKSLGQSAQAQALSGAVASARKLAEHLKKVPSEITRRSLLNRYNHLVRGGMSPDEAINFVSQKIKEDLKKEVQNG